MSNSLVRYGSFSLTAADQTASAIESLSNNAYAKIEAGDNVFRFLPPPPGGENPFKIASIHYVPGLPGMEKQILVFACPRATRQEHCPVCVKLHEMTQTRLSKEAFEQARKLQPNLRIMANVVPRKSPEPNVKILTFGKTIYEELISIRKNPRLGGDFTDPTENGFDIIIRKAGAGINTKYSVAPDRHSSPLHPDPNVAVALIGQQFDLNQYVSDEIPEELELVLNAMTSDVVSLNSRGSSGGRIPYQNAGQPALQPAPVVAPTGTVGRDLFAHLRTTAAAAAQPAQQTAADNLYDYDEDFNPKYP